MTIWLGYPETKSGGGAATGQDDIGKQLDEAIKLDDKITDDEHAAVKEVQRVKDEVKQKRRQPTISGILGDSRAHTKIEELGADIVRLDKKLTELQENLESMENKKTGKSYELSGLKRDIAGIKSMKIDSVSDLIVEQDRYLVAHHIPGRSGVDSEVSATVFQDMGRKPVRLVFRGVLVPEDVHASAPAQEYSLVRKIELLKWFFKSRVPLFFASRLVNRADMPTKVLIEYLQFEENNKIANRVEFDCRLVEYSDVNWTHGQQPQDFTRVKNVMKFQTLNEATRYRKKFTREGMTVVWQHERLAKALLSGDGVKELGISEEEKGEVNS